MNSELKKQVLESLRKIEWAEWDNFDCGEIQFCTECRNLKKHGHYDHCPVLSAIAAVEAEPEPSEKLTFEQIEACMPGGCHFVSQDLKVTVSTQWLLDFARNVESKVSVTPPVRVWNERDVEIVRATLDTIRKLLPGTQVFFDLIEPKDVLDSLKGR